MDPDDVHLLILIVTAKPGKIAVAKSQVNFNGKNNFADHQSANGKIAKKATIPELGNGSAIQICTSTNKPFPIVGHQLVLWRH
jgi:hypothetical protein